LSLDELRVRGTQKLSAVAERRGYSSLNSLPTDETFRAMLGFDQESLLEHFHTRKQPQFFANFAEREQVAALRRYWPDRDGNFLRLCDAVVAGEFDLLGLRKCFFGNPIDWHLEPTTGKRSPLAHWSRVEELDASESGDKKIVWELNRHQHFILLGQAYWLTGNERYAQAFASQLSSWIEQNPPKLGINWISSLEIAFRSISWIWSFYFFKESGALTSELFWRALKLLYLNARHIETYLSTYFSPNTHLTGEALGLYYLGTIFPEFSDAARWRSTGRKILLEHLPLHVKDDGVYFEQSSYYQRYTTDFYLHFLLLATRNNDQLPDFVGNKLQQALNHLMYITRPDGRMPLFGDDDGGRLMIFDPTEPRNDSRSSLAVGAVVFDRGDYKFVAKDARRDVLWLLGTAGLETFERLEAVRPGRQSVDFPAGGYYVMRDGWSSRANYLLFDCGPHGVFNCGHAHADALAFELAAQGRTQLIDPGTFTYTASKQDRDWFRSSAAHNALTLDGESSSAPAGPFSWNSVARAEPKSWISRERFDFVSGGHDGYRRLPAPATHLRSILFLKNDYWIILDEIESTGGHQAELYFHFETDTNPLIEPTNGPEVLVTERHEQGGLDVAVFGRSGRWRREEGWVSHCYANKEPSPLYIYSAPISGSERLVTFLLPRTKTARYEVREVKAIGGQAFEVTSEKGLDIVMIPASKPGVIEMDRLASNFAWTWARFSDCEKSAPVELVVLNGSALTVEGKQVLQADRRVEHLTAVRRHDEFLIDGSSDYVWHQRDSLIQSFKSQT
jgi:Heparinase II/III-like protein/Heparinase II/III N-terminus